jgi:hypothetical protein
MGLKCSPDFYQETIENIFRDVKDAKVYINGIGAFSNTWEHHINLLRIILPKLQNNGFSFSPLKCDWAVQETNWLGYWLTPSGLKPWKKKIDAVLEMKAPKSLKQLRCFVGMVTITATCGLTELMYLLLLQQKLALLRKAKNKSNFFGHPKCSLLSNK